jgi:hypothetical protein
MQEVFLVGVPAEDQEKAFVLAKEIAKRDEGLYGKFDKYSFVVSNNPPFPDYNSAVEKALEIIACGNENPSKRSYSALGVRYLNKVGDIEFLFFGWHGLNGVVPGNNFQFSK